VKTEIVRQQYSISKSIRSKALGQKPLIIWLTGLSGSGKSTIANGLEIELQKKGFATYLLDGDNIRHGLNNNIDFTDEGRKENIRRIGEVAKLFVDAGIIVITAFISPFRSDRDMVRNIVENDEFIEVYINCPVEICESRDVKGLYARARRGEIPHFTGISSPFEPPLHPELIIDTDKNEIEKCVNQILDYAYKRISTNGNDTL
jgi:adenylylsulfate kinase